MWYVVKDFSASIGIGDQHFADEYLRSRVFPAIHPGDRVIIGRIGSDALSRFEILLDARFQPAFFREPSPLSWRYFVEDADQPQRECIACFHKFQEELRNFEAEANAKLQRPATDSRTCLIDTFRIIAADFARYHGPKVLAATTDGIEECGSLDFTRRAPTAQTLHQLKAEGRIPTLTDVVVYFVCRTSSQTSVSYESIDRFWEAFFKESGARSVQVGPEPDFDYATQATVAGQCGH
jgi:hypothetical protein